MPENEKTPAMRVGYLLHLILIMSRGYYGLYVQYLADIDIIKISIAMLSKLFSSGNGWTFGLLYMSVGGFFAWHRNRYSLAILAPLLLLALVGFLQKVILLWHMTY